MVLSNNMYIAQHKIRVGFINLRKDQIIEYRFDDDIEIDVDDIEEIVDTLKRITKGKRYPMLVVTGERNDTTPEARKMSKEYLKKFPFATAEALIINSFPTRIAAKFYYNIYKPKHPVHFFKSEEEGLSWLKSFLN